MLVEKKSANSCKFVILKPENGERVRPMVSVATAKEFWNHVPGIKGLVNGTFFNSQSATPYVAGDVKTDKELAWDFPLKPFNLQPAQAPKYFWSPAAQIFPDFPGYTNRWAVVEKAGVATLAEFQPSSYSEYRDVDWVMGGGALVLRDGVVSAFGDGRGPLGLHTFEGGEFTNAQTYETTRSWLLITADSKVHLAVNTSQNSPSALAKALKTLGYRSAVMLDGGGATTLFWETGGTENFPFAHAGYPQLHCVVAIF